MKTLTLPNRHLLVSGVFAGLAVVAMGFSGTAQARDNLSFSVSVGGPGLVVGASNAYPVYSQPRVVYVQPAPVYVQPAPIYVQPRPVYVQPAPVYYQPRPVYYSAPPVYIQPQPVYYGRPPGWHHGHFKNRTYYGPGYAQVNYQRQYGR